MRENDGIKAFCYIHCDWSLYEQWKNWGDSRIDRNESVRRRWVRELDDPIVAHAVGEKATRRLLRLPEKQKPPQ